MPWVAWIVCLDVCFGVAVTLVYRLLLMGVGIDYGFGCIVLEWLCCCCFVACLYCLLEPLSLGCCLL